MRKSRFSEEQIIAILTEQERGTPTAEVCQRHGVSDATLYKWKAKYGGMAISDARRLKRAVTLTERGRRKPQPLGSADEAGGLAPDAEGLEAVVPSGLSGAAAGLRDEAVAHRRMHGGEALQTSG